jgi:hypothetical protein
MRLPVLSAVLSITLAGAACAEPGYNNGSCGGPNQPPCKTLQEVQQQQAIDRAKANPVPGTGEKKTPPPPAVNNGPGVKPQ